MARVAEAAALRAGPRFGNSVENRDADPPSVQIRSDAQAPIRNGQLALAQPLSRVHPPHLLRLEEAAARWLLSALLRLVQSDSELIHGGDDHNRGKHERLADLARCAP
jgi:hypothetical protein